MELSALSQTDISEWLVYFTMVPKNQIPKERETKENVNKRD